MCLPVTEHCSSRNGGRLFVFCYFTRSGDKLSARTGVYKDSATTTWTTFRRTHAEGTSRDPAHRMQPSPAPDEQIEKPKKRAERRDRLALCLRDGAERLAKHWRCREGDLVSLDLSFSQQLPGFLDAVLSGRRSSACFFERNFCHASLASEAHHRKTHTPVHKASFCFSTLCTKAMKGRSEEAKVEVITYSEKIKNYFAWSSIKRHNSCCSKKRLCAHRSRVTDITVDSIRWVPEFPALAAAEECKPSDAT
jgi:hypothetical protein